MRRRSTILAAAIAALVLLGVYPGPCPAAAQGVADGYVPAPAFGGAPKETPYTNAPVLLNREDVARALARDYPRALAQRGEGGNVYVWVLIDERGEVMSARVRGPSGKPALDASALRVTSSMRFKPGLKDGAPVKVWIALPVYFRVPEVPPPEPELRSRLTPSGASRPPSVNTPPPPEPSGLPSLLNGSYVLRQLRSAYAARFKGDDARGTTTLKLHVNIAGDAATAEIARSSGNPALDSLALSLKDMLVFVPAIRAGSYAEGTAELQLRFPPKEEK